MSQVDRKFPFTMERLRRLKPQEKVIRYYDAKTPGLFLSITPGDARTFYYGYASPELMIPSDKGPRKKSRQLVLGRFPSLTVDDSRKVIAEAASRLAAGVDPMEERQRINQTREIERAKEAGKVEWTLRYQLANHDSAYWRYSRREQLRGTEGAIQVMRKHFAWMMDTPMDTITTTPFQAWYDNEISKIRAQSSKAKGYGLNRATARLQAVFSQLRQATAQDEVPFKGNPFEGFRKFKEEKVKVAYLEPHEQERFLATLEELVQEKPHWDWFALLVKLGLATACRKGEMMMAKMDDFQKRGEEMELHIPAQNTKSKRAHVVPIVQPMWKLIQEYRLKHALKPNGYLFPRARGATHKSRDERQQWKTLLERANVSARFSRFHNLPAQFAVNAINAGVPIEQISKLLNHGSVQLTMSHYAHILPDTKAEAAAIATRNLF